MPFYNLPMSLYNSSVFPSPGNYLRQLLRVKGKGGGLEVYALRESNMRVVVNTKNTDIERLSVGMAW